MEICQTDINQVLCIKAAMRWSFSGVEAKQTEHHQVAPKVPMLQDIFYQRDIVIDTLIAVQLIINKRVFLFQKLVDVHIFN